jgi:alpha-L-rhamnosidase
MARVLGRDDDATRFDALFERIKTAFVADYVAEDGQIAGDAQTGYVLALQMDLLPADQRPAVARRLVADIAARDGHLSTGFVGIGHLLPVLTEAGSLDVAYRLLLNETFPSWGYMIRHGATTIWERWDGWTEERGFQNPGMNSFNHYAFGAVGAWLYRTIAGIDLDSDRPGFEHVVIRPRPGGDLTWARATYRSIRGPIASAWRIENGAFHLDVTIPANTTATVHVPTADASAITEGGVLTRDAPHVTFVREDAGAAVFGIAAGTYRFTSGSLAAMT